MSTELNRETHGHKGVYVKEKLNSDSSFYSTFPAEELPFFWTLKQRILILGVQKFLYRFPILAKIFRKIGGLLSYYGSFPSLEEADQKAFRLSALSGLDASDYGSGFGYEDEVKDLEVAIKYRSQILSSDFKSQASESSELYDNAIKNIENIILAHPGIKTFVNFGVSYAYVDSVLAKKFQNIKFIGIDRSILVQQFNEHFFGQISNLEFVSSDIFHYLDSQIREPFFLFHCRMACYLPQSFMAELYRRAFASGCQGVIAMEQVGMSREDFKLMRYSLENLPSKIYRRNMFLHNFPGLLFSSGFEVKNFQLLKTKHPHKDFRILSFYAQRSKPVQGELAN